MSEHSSAALLDVDGTLVDTNWLHALAWLRAFRQHGHDIPAARIHRLIGMASDGFIQELLGRDDDAVRDAWSAHFDQLKPEIRPLPGAVELVEQLQRRGVRVVLATSSHKDDLESILELLDVGEHLHGTVCKDDVDNGKPEPDIFAAALEKAGVAAERAVVVGDTVWDAEAAKRCGLTCIGVRTGGISPGELLGAGMAAVYDDAAHLAAELDVSPLGALLRG